MFDPESVRDVPWLADLVDIPDDASWPRYMTPVHPDAVGSLGGAVEEWLRESQGFEMRWWQRLATRRQLEVDAAGRLVWSTVVESCSRRVGKSSRLAGLATWRLAHAELFGEVQTVIHTGSDLAICREVQRRTWRWAEEVAGWTVTRANGKEAIEARDGSRWLTRAQNAVYGWDCSFGLVDEGWDVPPMVFDEGIEPATIERLQPQILLTSTAHRRASSLMTRRIGSALVGMGEDWDTLLLLWGAGREDDIGDPGTWRRASAYWTPARHKMILGKYERAMRGESDPEVDDVDPIEGFKAQLLNIWPEPDAVREPGLPVVREPEWADLVGDVPPGVPAVVAVEAHFGGGVSVGCAWPLCDGRVLVGVSGFPDLPAAAAAALGAGGGVLLVGKSLAGDPVFEQARVEPVGDSTRNVVMGLRELLDADQLRHDGGDRLSGQVLGLRTASGPDGPRVRSTGDASAVKVAVWAGRRARQPVGVAMIW